ncbi:MAG: hypothetical protein DRP55_05460 [Spirochaetes bacterium]|nr:hypothetical protein [Deltaproteobacteria bacterium]RKY00613.1 MAG: hypothetical protein DRP55_05460 [Spirochaetota bacterium]
MKKTLFSFFITIFCTIFIFNNIGFSAIINVPADKDLQAALTTAQNNGEDDTIYIAAGTYVGNFHYVAAVGENFSLTIIGAGASSTVLDGNNAGHVLRLKNEEGRDIFIQGLTVKKGNAN